MLRKISFRVFGSPFGKTHVCCVQIKPVVQKCICCNTCVFPVEDAQIASTVTAYANIEKEELLKIVHDALKNCSILTQTTFWMRMENIPARKVANKLNTTPQTVHNIFSKSLSIIREHIKKHYPEILNSGLKIFFAMVVAINYFFK